MEYITEVTPGITWVDGVTPFSAANLNALGSPTVRVVGPAAGSSSNNSFDNVTIDDGGPGSTLRVKPSGIGSNELAALAVVATKIAADAVETAKIKNGAVTAAKLATDAVETAKIKDAAVTAAKLDPSALPVAQVVVATDNTPGDSTGSTALPNATTTPTTGMGKEIKTLEITPTAGNTLVVFLVTQTSNTSVAHWAALFNGSTCIGSSMQSPTYGTQVVIGVETGVTATLYTFAARYGHLTGAGAATKVNTNPGGARTVLVAIEVAV